MTFSSTRLKNGLTVLTYNIPHIQSAAINLLVKVGGRYETEDEVGISHFLEHMAFKGTKTRSARNIAEEFDAIGGQFNAYTSREHTVYYSKVLVHNLGKSMDILADIMLNSTFDQEEISKEYNVILQEIAGTNDSPDDLAYEVLYDTAFSGHPMGRSILGTKDTISKFNSQSFFNYLDKHYYASNMYLSVSGQVNHDNVVQLAEELFAKLPNKAPKTFLPMNYVGGCKVLDKELEQTNIILAFDSVSYIDLQKTYHAQILSLILGGGLSSRLFQQIRENLGLAYGVGSYNSSYYDGGLFSIFAATNPIKLPVLFDNIAIEVKKIMEKIEDSELKRAKEQIKTSLYMAEERSNYKSESIAKNFAVFERYISVEEIVNYIESTTKNDLLSMAQQIFSSKPTLSVVGAKPEQVDYQRLVKQVKIN